MRRINFLSWTAFLVWGVMAPNAPAESDPPLLFHPIYEEPVAAAGPDGRIRLVQVETSPLAEQAVETEVERVARAFDISKGFDQFQPAAQVSETNAPSESIDSAPVGVIATPDVGGFLKDAPTVQTVSAQRRNPVAYDPHVRGFRFGQIYSVADGIWFPVRTDLDSMLTKIDPSLISNVEVIPGPYGVRYGPAFAFIDVQMAPTPRYQCGFESHHSLGSTYYHNGDQFYGRTSAFGGNEFWGFRVHYGNRTGSDYESGNGTLIPSSYQSQTLMGQVGFDLTEYSRVEFRYQHLDQNDTEYALQFFDIEYLGTNAYSVSYVNEDPFAAWTRMRVDAWHNITTFHGHNQNDSKAPVRDRVIRGLLVDFPTTASFVGQTDGSRSNFGTRAMLTYGDDDWTQLHAGADFRYDDQRLEEHFDILDGSGTPVDPNASPIDTELPTAWLVDPGVFLELSIPMQSYVRTTIGARVDWVRTGARASELEPIVNLNPSDVADPKNDVLYAFFAASDLELTPNSRVRAGFGHAQRPPSLIERYSDGVFLGIMQSGFSRVVGDPNLNEERLWQADVTLYQEYQDFRGRASAYYGWVKDFITYANNPVDFPAGARILQAVNTDEATLAGFELYGETDLTDMFTVFGAMSYVHGTDEEIDAPLWAIPPLQGQFGVRLHDPNRGRLWGLELAGRFVDNQDRVAFIRRSGAPGVIDRLEEPTPGFTTVTFRSYYNYSQNLTFVGGVDNLFDNNYIEHLDLRLPADTILALDPLFAFAPGANAYMGFEWTR